MWALLPLKSFSHAKQRLSNVLTSEERSGLFLAMVKDVLSVLQSHPDVDNILIVSDDDDARLLAKKYGAELLTESSLNASGLNQAVQAGVNVLSQRGINDVMIIHGDLPLITAAEISHLISVHRQRRGVVSAIDDAAISTAELSSSLTIAPDERREGTNFLLCSPASQMRFSYGTNSFTLHTIQASQMGMSLQVVHSPGAACDIDTPKDLEVLLQRANAHNAAYSFRYMAAIGLAERLGISNKSLYGWIRKFRQAIAQA